MVHKMKAMEQEHRSQLGKASEKRASLEATIKKLQSEIARLNQKIEEKDERIADLNRLAYPHRYQLLLEQNLPKSSYPITFIRPFIFGRKLGTSFLMMRNTEYHTRLRNSTFMES